MEEKKEIQENTWWDRWKYWLAIGILAFVVLIVRPAIPKDAGNEAVSMQITLLGIMITTITIVGAVLGFIGWKEIVKIIGSKAKETSQEFLDNTIKSQRFKEEIYMILDERETNKKDDSGNDKVIQDNEKEDGGGISS